MKALQGYEEEDLLFYDIETAPIVKELELDSPLFDSWAYKVNKAGDKTDQEIIESYSKEAGLHPEFAKIISIVAGKIADGGITLVTLDDEEESDLLEKYNKLIGRNSSCTLVGFFNKGFDAPYVFKRMIINGIAPKYKLDHSGLKPWEIEELDLSELWKGSSISRASLINIAVAFGLPSPKDGIDGSKVGYVYWNEEGGLKRISKYCRRDVVTTINIYRKMLLKEALEVKVGGDFEEKPLIVNLFGGGDYGKEEAEELEEILRSMTPNERRISYVLLESMTSTAKGKKTTITKADVKVLKEKLDGKGKK